MKRFKLSKSQWNLVGKIAGWAKTSQANPTEHDRQEYESFIGKIKKENPILKKLIEIGSEYNLEQITALIDNPSTTEEEISAIVSNKNFNEEIKEKIKAHPNCPYKYRRIF